MSTRTQQHKSKTAQIACAVAAYALAPIQSALGVTAADRFRAMQNLNNDGGFMKSKWFTAAMLLVLVGSITTLVTVSLYRKLREGRRQKTENRERKTENKIQKTENIIQNTELKTQNSKSKTVDIEQRVSNIEKQVSAIEKRLTNLEQEVSSFEVIEDESNAIQASANADEGAK